MVPEQTPWIDRWGSDPWSWNVDAGTDDEECEDPGDGSGRPGRALVGSALVFWSSTAPGCSVEAAATCFNLRPSFAHDAMRADLFDACDLAEAVQTWSLCRGGACPVSMAASVFGMPVSRIVEAVASHSWMFMERRDGLLCIGHEGE